ncbi:MAG TPA: hypothetical protein VHM70_16115 [Polyangiaceae bacterium]|jgi:hypothetical protein|nr:hypothetical protein [Polyangiaceae bacterium]
MPSETQSTTIGNVRIAQTPPPAGEVPLRTITVVDGQGCGLLGTTGTREGAIRRLSDEAQRLGADYVQILEEKGPYPDHECVHKEYTLKGQAFRFEEAPAPSNGASEQRGAIPEAASVPSSAEAPSAVSSSAVAPSAAAPSSSEPASSASVSSPRLATPESNP